MFSANSSQVSNDANYIEDVFSTWLYTGNGSTTTINNGIDVSGEGGLVWVKARANGNRSHTLFDSATYTTGQYYLATNITNGFLDTGVAGTFALNNSGFSVSGTSAQWNASGESFVSWTFRKQPKFFDVVTYTGNGASYQDVAHRLGSTPGCIMVKCTSTGSTNWMVAHRASALVNANLILNSNLSTGVIASETIAYSSVDGSLNGVFRVLNDLGTADPANYLNVNGQTYVAYLFAHNAGGFGLTGTDNVISCGSATASVGTWTDVNVGFEPQWVLIKNSTATGSYNPSGSAGSQDWYVIDTMRGATAATGSNTSTVALSANSSIAEYNDVWFGLTSTGFSFKGVTGGSDNFIYIAIRRGPMKVPTSGTSVFTPSIRTGTGTTTTVSSTSFPPDLYINGDRTYGGSNGVFDRLRGRGILQSFNTAAENATSPSTYDFVSWGMNGEVLGAPYNINMTGSGRNFVDWNFGRAPSFMDVVCGTSASSGQTWTSNHNLGVAPELVIMKTRGSASSPDDYWWAAQVTANKFGILNTNGSMGAIGSTLTVSATSFTGMVGYIPDNTTMVAYLFATCAGVSKVGSYTGTGATQTIDCGFTGGARFVLIKRTNATGDWCVWDTARGMVSGTDPRLFLNSSSAEYNNDWVYTTTGGFQIVTSDTNVNASGSTYIFLAIA